MQNNDKTHTTVICVSFLLEGLAQWANASVLYLLCVCLVFILYLQPWLFVHGMFLVFLIH